jgi:hypothetical protein
MLTITTEKRTLYINVHLLKSRFKNAVIALLKISIYILAFAGVAMIIGTEEASKTTDTTVYQIITNCLKGFSCIGFAYGLNFIKSVIE